MAVCSMIHDLETSNLTTSISKTVTIKGSHNFKIHGYSFTKGMGVGNYISSDTFSVEGHLWEIHFYPDGYKKVDESGDIYVSVFINLVSKFVKGTRVWYEYLFLDESGNKWYKSNGIFKRLEKDKRWMVGPFCPYKYW